MCAGGGAALAWMELGKIVSSFTDNIHLLQIH